MITDYKSFIAGVQLGRRLRIWDAVRLKQPPVPSGVYILTEDGTPIITEVFPFEVTNFIGGEWYMFSQYASFRPDAAVVDTGFAVRLQRVGGNTPNYFMWLDTENNRIWEIWWTDDPTYLNRSNFYLYRLGEQYAIESTGTSERAATQAGSIWYHAHSSDYRPDNARVFTGTPSELQSYLAGLASRNMITE